MGIVLNYLFCKMQLQLISLVRIENFGDSLLLRIITCIYVMKVYVQVLFLSYYVTISNNQTITCTTTTITTTTCKLPLLSPQPLLLLLLQLLLPLLLLQQSTYGLSQHIFSLLLRFDWDSKPCHIFGGTSHDL